MASFCSVKINTLWPGAIPRWSAFAGAEAGSLAAGEAAEAEGPRSSSDHAKSSGPY
jgi:hypothetical protein